MNDYPVAEAAKTLGDYIPPTVRQRLEKRKADLERSLGDVNAALEMLNSNPAFEAVHDAIAKAGF